MLEDSREDFHSSLRGVGDSEAKIKPAQDRWSILDCVEHVSMVEERFLQRLEGAERMSEPRIDKPRETELAARVPSRAVRAQAPEPVRPVGRFANLEEALDHFNAIRDKTISFAENRSGDLYWLSAEHPRFGPLNAVELLVVIAGHSRRHAQQIREVRADLP